MQKKRPLWAQKRIAIYQGQYYDKELDLCYNRYRYFDPLTCSFISQDPLGLTAGENVYAYCPNVWNWVDPLGLAKNSWIPHNPAQNDVISKGVHFNASNGVELKVMVNEKGDIIFDKAFNAKYSNKAVNEAIEAANERFNNNTAWREQLQETARKAKHTLFETFNRHDKAKEVKKLEKAIKKINMKNTKTSKKQEC